MSSVYLDYNATTPLDPEILAAMRPFIEEEFGNPSSIHHRGRRARAALDEARERISGLFQGKPSEVVFTSGGTESVNFAILGTARALRQNGRHIVTSAIEHHAVLHACRYLEQYEGFEISRVPTDRHGLIDPDQFNRSLRPDTVLASVMAANNEIGTVQPLAALASRCRAKGVLFHTDAVQWPGKMPFASLAECGADLISFCAHKILGPKGTGGLFIRSPFKPVPLIFGGGHEGEMRAGTENVAGCVGLSLALERCSSDLIFSSPRLLCLVSRVLQCLRAIPDLYIFSSAPVSLPNTISFAARGCDQLDLLALLDLGGFCASGGAACSSGALEPSHVILALGFPADLASGLIRFSLGRETTDDDISRLVSVLPRMIASLRTSE